MEHYKADPWLFTRYESGTIKVGNVKMGADFPVRVQSMANTSTSDIEASINQSIEIIEEGGELVRFTVINSKDADALAAIKKGLVEKGYDTPLVADIHFNPDLADIAAVHVDKVRINPGNYLDKRATFSQVDFSDEEYFEELKRLEDRFVKFLKLCTDNNTAIRIGTNHGSLSDRIMSRFGDTPAGMVEATMEFLRLCKKHAFNNVAVSLKSSNTRVMVQACRLLVKQMNVENMNFCLHLGVTEAGSAEEGRIKSAVGIGSLMNDGIGDTIRVSLTEHPAKEIPVANVLVEHFDRLKETGLLEYKQDPVFNSFEYKKRVSNSIDSIGGKNLPVVIADLSAQGEIEMEHLIDLDFKMDKVNNVFVKGDLSPDIIYSGESFFPYKVPQGVSILIDCHYWDERVNAFPLFSWDEYRATNNKSSVCNFVQLQFEELSEDAISTLKEDNTVVIVCYSSAKNQSLEIRAFFNELLLNDCKNPVIIQRLYRETNLTDFQIKSAADNGIFFIDGLGDGLWLKQLFKGALNEETETAFSILQASRTRTTKTEYISCPGCGRTLFDLEKTLAEVKASTTHLKGLKIAVMGCIVNGPGEMADADYGYVGAGPGKVSLYKGKELVKRNIDTENAVEELLKIIE